MGNKTIIIAWRFKRENGEKNCSYIKILNGYKIIIYYTIRRRPIKYKCFTELKNILSNKKASNLFVFIHSHNFKDHEINSNKTMEEVLLEFNNRKKNILVKSFSGGGFLYDKFIDMDSEKLKSFRENDLKAIFEELDFKYGKFAPLKSKLNLLHECLSPDVAKKINNGRLNELEQNEKERFKEFQDKIDPKSEQLDDEFTEYLLELRNHLIRNT